VGRLSGAFALSRLLAGFAATDLFPDLASGGPYTVIGPLDHAFDALPWSFAQLLADEALVEERFDLFESFVVTGEPDSRGRPRRWPTLHGGTVTIGAGVVGSAVVLGRTTWQGLPLLVVDSLDFAPMKIQSRPAREAIKRRAPMRRR
jgi:hypothetical protein